MNKKVLHFPHPHSSCSESAACGAYLREGYQRTADPGQVTCSNCMKTNAFKKASNTACSCNCKNCKECKNKNNKVVYWVAFLNFEEFEYTPIPLKMEKLPNQDAWQTEGGSWCFYPDDDWAKEECLDKLNCLDDDTSFSFISENYEEVDKYAYLFSKLAGKWKECVK